MAGMNEWIMELYVINITAIILLIVASHDYNGSLGLVSLTWGTYASASGVYYLFDLLSGT